MSNKVNRDSPLVKSVLALDHYLSELERVGQKINSTDMTSDFDADYIQKLMTRFSESAQGVSKEVTNLSTHLNEARARAEAVAQGVSRQADLLQTRKAEQDEKLEQFRLLGERVRELNTAISAFRRPQQGSLTRDDQAKLAASIPAFEAKLVALIEELEDLRKSARESRMKALERNAESLAQTLQAVRQKLRVYSGNDPSGDK
jgi:hypothetical protein